jgi:hypothetical protein
MAKKRDVCVFGGESLKSRQKRGKVGARFNSRSDYASCGAVFEAGVAEKVPQRLKPQGSLEFTARLKPRPFKATTFSNG